MSDQEQTISMEVIKNAMQAARDVILQCPTIINRNNYLTSDEYTSDEDAYDQRIGKRLARKRPPPPRIIKMSVKYGYSDDDENDFYNFILDGDDDKKVKEEKEKEEEEEEEDEEKEEEEKEEDSDRTPPPSKKFKF